MEKPDINRRDILKSAVGASLVGMSFQGIASASEPETEEITLFSVPANKGNKSAVVTFSEADGARLGVRTGNKVHYVNTGGETPYHPVWNKKGNRLAVSLNGEIHIYNSGGKQKNKFNPESRKLTDGPFHFLPLFQDGDLIVQGHDQTYVVRDVGSPSVLDWLC
ncbi:hypothetical protein PM033_15250 [Halorubrum ezzemoulense]|uniref:hypothetical protein n=1 Tax=Halorubrum ezzemoulense TaxID=337243 RepID=UPI002330767D|nr:hypothetical protein [Halorubrum ezzemoulense]MDB2253101.1 hypothetical protein [Halorubrum ezzemoulense]